MNRLRKLLAAVFAALSVYFAYVAYTNRDSAREGPGGRRCSEEWGRGALAAARKCDKLIYFSVSGAPLRKMSGRTKAILQSHFISTELNPAAYPADYEALRRIFARSSAPGEASAGILSPRGFPISIWASPSGGAGGEVLDLRRLSGALTAYAKNRAEVKSGIRIAVRISGSDPRLTDIPNFFTGGGAGLAELANLRIFFAAGNWRDSAALLTENARLAARLSQHENPAAREVALEAYAAIEGALSRSAKLHQRMLVARAFSEYALAGGFPDARGRFLEMVDGFEKLRGADGFFPAEGNASMRENALMMSLFARAAALGADGYADALWKLSEAVREKMDEKSITPALLRFAGGRSGRSEAAALDCALLIRGWLDAYFATGEGEYLRLAAKTFDKFDSEFGDPSTGAWFGNSSGSTFSESLRYRDSSDGDWPSGIGEGAQAIADMSAMRGEQPERLFRILSPANAAFFAFKFPERASLKLSMFENPMLLIKQQKTPPNGGAFGRP